MFFFFAVSSYDYIHMQLKRLQICKELKQCFDKEGQLFLDRIVTCDETWVHNFTLESKHASKAVSYTHLDVYKRQI